MLDKKVRELLEQLQDELDHVDSLDQKGRDLLNNIAADINRLLKSPSIEPDESVLRRLEDTIDHFKIEHPKLTMALSEMMTILSNAGI
ncbi:MAG: DUF4404 family protein [Anaerolineales bacterium]|nr:MAG: DUF4404 family protein [Anaerolineales bacterium]